MFKESVRVLLQKREGERSKKEERKKGKARHMKLKGVNSGVPQGMGLRLPNNNKRLFMP